MNYVAASAADMSAPAPAALVEQAAIDAFARNGAICLRGVFDHDWIDKLAVGVEKNFAAPGPYHSGYTAAGKPGGFSGDYCNWQRIDEYRDFIQHSPAGEIAARLMRSRAARIYHEHVLVKEPGTEEATPWHHDLPYYGLAGSQLCSLWLPLDEVPQSACPRFVAGSHASAALYYPRLFLNHENYSEGVAGFENVPDIDAERGQHNLLSWQLGLGDCIVFHMRALHDAPPTVGHPTRRRGFSTRWLGDDARFATRPWETSPPFPQVRLQPGDAMEHPLFPVIWQR